MKRIVGPHTELDFYFPNLSEKEALSTLVRTVEQLGATFAGTGYAYRGPEADELAFGNIWDIRRELIQVDSANFDMLMNDPNIRVLSVHMFNAVGSLEPDLLEEVTYPSISVPEDTHPVGIYTSGDPFHGPAEINPGVEKAGALCYERFIALANLTQPAYGGIFVEASLDNPAVLQKQLTAFEKTSRNTFQPLGTFYLGEAFAGPENIERFQELNCDAYIEQLEHGVYVSNYWPFNPKKINVRHTTDHRVEMAKIIVNSAKNWGDSRTPGIAP